MLKFEMDERVVFYTRDGRQIGIITDRHHKTNLYQISVRDGSGNLYWCHEKQLRRIKQKPARTWWVNERLYKKEQQGYWHSWFEQPGGFLIRTIEPEDKTGWIKLVEEKK